MIAADVAARFVPRKRRNLMLKTLALTAAALLTLAAGISACGYPVYSYRYRMTVIVDVSGQLRSGSSVIEVRTSKQPRITPETRVLNESVEGDAVFVNLDGKKNLIAALASANEGVDLGFTKTLVPSHFHLNLFEDGALIQLSQLRGRWELSGRDLPLFIALSDLTDPKTARLVKPDEFGQVFGSGIRLREVTIEMTTDPVTREISAKLPWLSNEPSITQFFRSLVTSGLRPKGSIEPGLLLKRKS